MNQLEQGREHLANGDVKQAIVAFYAATQEQPSPRAWHELGVSLALAGRWEDVVRVVNIANPPVPFFHNLCLDLMQRGEYELLGQMHREIPETHPISPVAIYFAGVSLIAAKRHLESLAHFHEFKVRVLNNLDHFRPLLADSNFHVIFRQGTLVEPMNFVAALDDGTITVEEQDPTLEFQQMAPLESSSVLYACCLNDLYFLRFSDSLVAGLFQACGAVDLHFHVIGDPKDCREHFDALAKRYPEITFGLSFERIPLARHSVYYACDRFVVLPQLLDAYGRNIMMLDADALVLQDLTPIAERLGSGASAADFACFDTGRTEPASVYQATLMYFANSAACRAFLQLMRRFIFSKLGNPPGVTWMLDQAALFSVSLFLETADDRKFVFQRLDKLTGEDLSDFVDSAGTQEEKRSLMDAGSPA